MRTAEFVGINAPWWSFCQFISPVFSYGFLGLFGWLSVCIVVVVAFTVIIRHLWHPECHQHGTVFFQIQHVGLLVFLQLVGVNGILVSCTYCCLDPQVDIISVAFGRLITDLAIGLTVFLVLAGFVAKITRIVPKPTVLSCVSLVCVLVSIVLLIGGISLIVQETR